MDIEKILEYINGLEEFIFYNVEKNFIQTDTTVEGLLDFVGTIRDSYIPLIEQINNSMTKNTHIQQIKQRPKRGRKPKTESVAQASDSE